MTQIYLAHNGLYRNQEYDDRGRIISSFLNSDIASASAISYRYQYDNYGNRTAKTYYYGSNTIQSYEWERGRLLKNIKNTSGGVVGAYTYDVNGVRYTKTANGVTTTYFYNGNTLLGENRSDGKRLRYFYDATGLCGFSYYNGNETKYYTYVKDAFGSVISILRDNEEVARYSYDPWGRCTILENVEGIAMANPIRWKSLYYDTESKLYYIDGRYYSPEIRQFLSPVPVGTMLSNAMTVFGLNPYLITLDNCVNRLYNQYTLNSYLRMSYNAETISTESNQWLGCLLTGVTLAGLTIAAIVTSIYAPSVAPIVIGAANGALFAGAINLGTQLFTKGVNNVNSWEVFSSTLAGAITGAVSAGIGNFFSPSSSLLNQSIAKPLFQNSTKELINNFGLKLGMAYFSTAVSSLLSSENVDWTDIGIATAVATGATFLNNIHFPDIMIDILSEILEYLLELFNN